MGVERFDIDVNLLNKGFDPLDTFVKKQFYNTKIYSITVSSNSTVLLSKMNKFKINI